MIKAHNFMSQRLIKYFKLLLDSRYWPALGIGVAATVEHAAALGGDEFATVIDVGANKGQFADYARTRWPRARLVCFEPFPGPRAKLAWVTDGQAEIHKCALGATSGEGRMHLASGADSSSLLALGAHHKAIFGMTESGELHVPIRRLDANLSTPLRRPVLLKIDVQGFELEVLKGAAGALPEIDVTYVEASFIELYKGQSLHTEIERFLLQHGYRLRGHFINYLHDGEPVQADLLFLPTHRAFAAQY